MDNQSTVEQNLAPPIAEKKLAPAGADQPTSANSGPRFPAEDGGHSLAVMASRDLDAALQLLAERAQYITGAGGAMIALRRGEHNEMLCRASAGSNAPELGALLSMEYGFSGESVRTRQALRCDDAERDPRVNREGCRQLGIASVMVTPILSDQQVLGVFELFSGKPNAFAERDLSALQRLSQMVETAVRYAVAAQTVPALREQAIEESQPPVDQLKPEPEMVQSHAIPPTPSQVSAVIPLATDPPPTEPQKTEPVVEVLQQGPEKTEPKTPSEPAPKKQLFWTAAMHGPVNSAPTAEAAESMAVPVVLRNLHKCQACGFPVSQGRKFCVECEEKQWRGQRLPQAASRAVPQVPSQPHPAPATDHASKISTPKHVVTAQSAAAPVSSPAKESTSKVATSPPTPLVTRAPQKVTPAPVKSATISSSASRSVAATPPQNIPPKPDHSPVADIRPPFLSSALESESWLAANKYILGALLLVAIIIATFALLR
ncbi:MAG: diguanylate cyclase [Candidatus Sulfotelmatobacter sp.]|nr:diguanylate cyclase [Candidatus Sulfotelmatobacter sp.]